MNKILTTLFRALCPILLLVSLASAQTTTTPNLGLTLPPAEPNSWGEDYNNNFLTLDTAYSGSAEINRVTFATLPTPPVADQVVVITDGNPGSCAAGGGSAEVLCQWNGSAWVAIAGAGHTIQDEGSSVTQRSTLDFTGAGVSCTDSGGKTVCVITGSALSVSGTGLVVQSSESPQTFAARSVTNTGGGLTITNPAGVGGNINIDPSSVIMRTDASNTVSTGDQSFAAATSLTKPIAAGAAPTASGRMAYDSTANKHKLGTNGGTETTATEEWVAALDHDDFANREDIANHPQYVYAEDFAGTPPNGSCDQTKQVQIDNTTGQIYGCITSGGNPIPQSTFNNSIVGETDGTNTTTSTGPITTQVGYASQLATQVRVWTAKNGSGTSAFATQPSNDGIEVLSSSASDNTQTCTAYGTTNGGDQSAIIQEDLVLNGVTQVASTKTDWGKIYVVQCDGVLVGTLTIREASGNVTMATIIAGQSYAANANTRFFKAGAVTTKKIWIPAGAMSVSGSCLDTEPTERTPVASGPKRYTINPADDNTCSFEFDIPTPSEWNAGTVTVENRWLSTTNQSGEVVATDWAANAVSSGDQVPAHSITGEREAACTFGAQTNDEQHCTTSPAITINGTPAAGDQLYFRGQIDATATTYTPTSAFTELHLLGAVVTLTLQ